MLKTLKILFMATLVAGCTSETNDRPGHCVPVKYLRGICGQAVLQIQDPRYYELGETADGDDHVFLARLECSVDDTTGDDKLFYVELNPENFNDNCAVCLALIAYSGSKHYQVRIHEVCGDTQE